MAAPPTGAIRNFQKNKKAHLTTTPNRDNMKPCLGTKWGQTNMKSNEVVRAAMKAGGISQANLAAKLNYKTQSGVGNALNRENGMRVDVFVKMMNAMDYEVVVRRGEEEFLVTE